MISHRPIVRTLLAGCVAVFLLGVLAPDARAGSHYKLYREGKNAIAARDYDRAQNRLFRAYVWAKRERGDRINPDYVVSYCQILVIRKDWYKAKRICAEAVRLARGSLARKAARFNRMAQQGKRIEEAANRAKWGERYLRNGRYGQAIAKFRQALKLYPSGEHYFGLCRALAADKQLAPAVAACHKALRAEGSGVVAARVRRMLRTLKKARANALTPAQANAVARILKATVDLQFFRWTASYGGRRWDKLVATLRSCVAATGQAVALGLASSTKVEVERFGGLKTTMVRNVQNGRFLGWKHFATIAAVAGQCRRYAAHFKVGIGGGNLAPYRKALRGDKLKTFRKYGLVSRAVYTRKHRRLQSPRDFRRASVWYLVTNYTRGCAYSACWRLHRFQFRGNRLRRVTKSTGRGRVVPRSRFR